VTTAQANTQIQHGIFPNLSFEEYLAIPCLSQSTLKEGRKSMAHLHAAMTEEWTDKPTDDMLLGSALHCAFLEPEMMPEKVVKWDGGARRGPEWKAFLADHGHQIILTEAMHAKLIGMTRSLRNYIRSRPELRKWYSQIEGTELSIVGEVHGVTMKGRVDALTPDPLFDLKKVADGDLRLFQSNAHKFGYGIQAYVYLQLTQRERFILLTVEDYGCFDAVSYELDEQMMREGRREACELLNRVAKCQASGVWPGRGASGIQSLSLPAWVSVEPEPAVKF
jgi:hypothetical protein